MDKYAVAAITLLAGLLFFLMLFTPRTYQAIKIPPLAILVLLIVARACLKGTIPIHRTVFLWFLFYLSYGALWILIGSFNGNPGIQDYIRLNLIWVVLYGVLILGISNARLFNVLLTMIAVATLCIAFYNVYILMNFLGLAPDNFITSLDLTGAYVSVGQDVGVFRMTAHNIGTLAFSGPYLMALSVLIPRQNRRRHVLVISAFCAAFVTIVLSGRRAIWILLAMTPMIVYLLNYFNPTKDRAHTKRLKFIAGSMLVIVLLTGIVLQAYTSWSFADVQEFMNEGLHDDDIRTDQANALLKGFSQHYLIGSGFGAGAPGFVRSIEQPWVYELSYHVLLYNTGMIGVLIYCVCIGWIYYWGIRVMQRDATQAPVMVSLLTGMTAFLIANATNPYLFSYDFMWILFLPIAHINLVLLNSGTKKDESVASSMPSGTVAVSAR